MSGPASLIAGNAIKIASTSRIEELLERSEVAAVFTPLECRLSRAGRGVESWAGRLAAKQAVSKTLGLGQDLEQLSEVEIVPCTDGCPAGGLCDRGHRPTARLYGEARERSSISPIVTVSHVPSLAIALAVLPSSTCEHAVAEGTPWAVGVDVLDLRRVRRWIEHDQPKTRRRLLTDREQAWSNGSVDALARYLTLKESAVKVVGRRPPGTTWHDVTVSPIRLAPPAGNIFARAAVEATDAREPRFANLELAGRLADELSRLDEDRESASVPRLSGVSCTAGRHVIGVAWISSDREPCRHDGAEAAPQRPRVRGKAA